MKRTSCLHAHESNLVDFKRCRIIILDTAGDPHAPLRCKSTDLGINPKNSNSGSKSFIASPRKKKVLTPYEVRLKGK